MALAKYAYTCAAIRTGNIFLAISEKQPSSGTTVTLTSGEISTFTVGAASFKQVGFALDSLVRKEETPEFDNVPTVNKSIEATVAAPSLANNTFFDALIAAIPCGVHAIVGDGGGKYWLVGWSTAEGWGRPLNMLSMKFDSGATPGEKGKGVESFTLSGKSGYRSVPFDTTLGAALAAGTSVFVSWN